MYHWLFALLDLHRFDAVGESYASGTHDAITTPLSCMPFSSGASPRSPSERGYKPLDNRQHILACYEAFKQFVGRFLDFGSKLVSRYWCRVCRVLGAASQNL